MESTIDRKSKKKKEEAIVVTAVPPELKERFQRFCTANGTTMSAMIGRLMRACLERHGVGKE